MSEYPAGVPSNLFELGDSFIISLFPSTAVYGANIALSYTFIHSLVQTRSKRRRVEVLSYAVYVLILMTLATHATAYNIQSLISSVVFSRHTENSNVGLPISLPLVVLITDLFMFWWCFKLFSTVSDTSKAFISATLSVFTLLKLGSVILFIREYPSMQHADYWTLGNINNLNNYYDLVSSLDGSIFIFFAATAGINTIITITILSRLIGIHNSMDRQTTASPEQWHLASKFTTSINFVTSLLVKSNSLSTVFALTGELSFGTHFQSIGNMNVPRLILPQISVLSMLLLIRCVTVEHVVHPPVL